MRRLTALSVAAAAVAGLAACTSSAPELPTAAAAASDGLASGQCFFSRDVAGFANAGPDAVNLRVGASDVYRLDLLTTCPDLPFAIGIGLVKQASATAICSPLDAELVVRGPNGPQRCPVKSIRKLTAEDVSKLPRKQRP